MLIGICGGICAGKASIADFLVHEHGFRRMHLARSSRNGSADVTSPLPSQTEKGLSLRFSSPAELLDFVTARWREHWVTTDIWDDQVLDVLQRRPFFLLISVDAPLVARYDRLVDQAHRKGQTPISLADFVKRNDSQFYGPSGLVAHLLSRAQLRILNNADSPEKLYAALRKLDLTCEDRLRPSWDKYFMQLADLAAQRSNCMKRSVGCVLVRGRRVISTGYNGTPRGMQNCNEGGCKRCNASTRAGMGLDTCLCLHAEENALLEAGRERVGESATLYCNTCPCLTCSVKISQIGISEVVYSMAYSVDSAAKAIFAETGVKLRQFSPPKEGLIDLNPSHDVSAASLGLNDEVGGNQRM